MLKLRDMIASNKHGQFWCSDSNGLRLKDLSFVASSLFSLVEGSTSMSHLAKISITTGSKLVFEKIDNVGCSKAENIRRSQLRGSVGSEGSGLRRRKETSIRLFDEQRIS